MKKENEALEPIPYKEYYTNNVLFYEPFEQALAQCKDEGDVETAKTVIRGHRNKLLSDTDARLSLDRLNLKTPAWTLTGLIEFIRTMTEALTGKWAIYRQALRDVPQQAGFPFDVKWPDIPTEDDE